MSDQGEEQDRRMLFIAGLAIVILALTFRALNIMEASLEQGSGLGQDVQTTTIPLMILIVALLLMMVSQIGRGPIQLSVENLRIAALMIAMFLIGMIIEPSISLPSDLPAENALGIIILLIPAILILAMVLPNGSNTKEEEE